VVFVVVAAGSPVASWYFDEPRLTSVLLALASTVVISGFGSMGPMLARKEFSYGLEVKIMLIARVTALGTTIAFAFILRNYWALVMGALVGHVVSLASSYILHPYRPRLSFAHAREFWGFSQWMLLSGIGIFFARKIDGFVVGRVGTAAEVGLYNLSLEFGSMVTGELGAPLNRALLPVLATLQDQPLRLRDALMQTVGAVNLVTLPAGFGLAMVAPLAVEVLLGPQWSAAAPLLALFSFIGAIRFTVGPYYTLFLTVGRSRLIAFMSWSELGIFAVATAFLLPGGIAGIAQARLISTVIIVAVWIVLGQANGLGVRDLMAAVVRPLIGSLLMCAAIWALPPLHILPVFELALKIAVGGLVYIVWATAAWHLQGRPDGFERRIVDYLVQRRAASR
jgi:lipopolysaccharide exporter